VILECVIDERGRVQDLKVVKALPLLAPVTFYLTVLGFIGTFQAFTQLYVMREAAVRDAAPERERDGSASRSRSSENPAARPVSGTGRAASTPHSPAIRRAVAWMEPRPRTQQLDGGRVCRERTKTLSEFWARFGCTRDDIF